MITGFPLDNSPFWHDRTMDDYRSKVEHLCLPIPYRPDFRIEDLLKRAPRLKNWNVWGSNDFRSVGEQVGWIEAAKLEASRTDFTITFRPHHRRQVQLLYGKKRVDKKKLNMVAGLLFGYDRLPAEVVALPCREQFNACLVRLLIGSLL